MISPWVPLRRLYYGWWMVLVGALILSYEAGARWYGFSVLFKPIAAEFRWGRALTVGAFSLSNLENSLLAPPVGWAIDRWGPRRVIFAGTLLYALGYIALSFVNSLLAFYFVYVVILGVGAQACGFAANSAAVVRWFQRRRALAIGMISFGGGLGGLFVPQALAWFVMTYDWRTAALAAGIGMLLLGVPLSLVMRTHSPAHYGLMVDGAAPHPGPLASAAPSVFAPREGISARQALRTRPFWILVLALSLGGGAFPMLTAHLVPLLTDQGLPMALAALGIGALTLSTLPGRLGFALFGDRFDVRTVFAVAFALQAAGLVGLAFFHELFLLFLAVAFFGLGAGATLPARAGMLAQYFGPASYATIMGWLFAFTTIGTLLGPLVAGWAFDFTASYQLALLAYTFACLVSIALLPLMGPPEGPSVSPPRTVSGG